MNKTLKLFNQAGVLALGLMVFSGCGNEEEISPASEPRVANLPPTKLDRMLNPLAADIGPALTREDAKKLNAQFEVIAQGAAKALQSKGFRELIKAEASKRRNGQFDALYSLLKDQSVDGQLFKSVLSSSLDRLPNGLNTFVGNSQDLEASVHPLLNFSVPVHIEDWDTDKFVPLVAIFPVDYDEATATRVKAYNGDGEVVWLDAKREPGVPVVVVGLNEREGLRGSDYYLSSDWRGLGPVQANPSNARLEACRVDMRSEILGGFKFTDINMYEDWLAGDVEVRLRIAVPNASGPDARFASEHPYEEIRRLVQQEFRAVGYNLFPWSTGAIGNIVTYHWTEEDWPHLGLQEVTVSVGRNFSTSPSIESTIGLKFGTRDTDDIIGQRWIDFRDCTIELPIGSGFVFKTGQ
ncbi:MAG: hypothetical protein MUC97_01090 [Bernardetiaceae bacterium]|jgi:hypothetical protein|nr:hypothetical protein [Bernardetiaceae bacterium]